jgi:hypothetical protein
LIISSIFIFDGASILPIVFSTMFFSKVAILCTRTTEGSFNPASFQFSR